MKTTPVTLKDIARYLNLSPSSVSRALKDHPEISLKTKMQVMEVAARLNYRPNVVARGLKKRQTDTIGVIIPEIVHYFFSQVISGIEEVAYNEGYTVMICQSNEKYDREINNVHTLLAHQVAGILVSVSKETSGFEHLQEIKKEGIPLVFFDRAFENMKFSRVVFNDKPGAANSINCIIKEGYTRFANFAGYSDTNIGKERLDGYIDALAKNKIPVKKDWIIEGGFEFRDGYGSFKKLISSGSLPEVIFTVNDRVALGAYKAAKEAGLNIPEDIGIFGYGFNEITDFFDPQFTVINQDPRKMGQEAIKLIINEIEEGTKKGKSRILIEEEFLWRKSVKRKMGKLNK